MQCCSLSLLSIERLLLCLRRRPKMAKLIPSKMKLISRTAMARLNSISGSVGYSSLADFQADGPLSQGILSPSLAPLPEQANGSRDLGDYKEGYYNGIEVPRDDPEAEKPFYGPNLWPEADILPGWRETMERYHREALEVGRAIARIIALALDLNGNFFDQPKMLGKPIATLRLLHYEGKISEPARGIYGAGAHTDFGFLTLLATDDVIGLQICKDKHAEPQIWEYVSPLKG